MKDPLNQGQKTDYIKVLTFILVSLMSAPLLAQSFVTTWVTDDTEITIPTNVSSGAYNYDITWMNLTNAGVGNGSASGQTADYTITGLTNGDTYEIAISGDFPHFYINNGSEKEKLRTIEQWGGIVWKSMLSAFWGCEHMQLNASDIPDLSEAINLERMFAGAVSFDGDLSNWDLSAVLRTSFMFWQATSFNNAGQPLTWTTGTGTANVAEMRNMFYGATSFNQDISSWDVSAVTHMNEMFRDATAFNNGGQPLDWTQGTGTSNVLEMRRMFENASAFNQDISSWDVSSVTTMQDMFSFASSFNNGGQPLTWTSGTSTSNVEFMHSMFVNAVSFNQDVSSWDVSSVTTMQAMFHSATSFNNGGQPLTWTSGLGTSNVGGMAGMFQNASAFNQDISSWDVSSVVNMQSMFESSTAFNNGGMPLIWTAGTGTSNVSNMSRMFFRADVFNQDVSGWDVSNVTNMQFLFRIALAFDQSLADWDISSASNMDNMLDGTNLSIQNYDATLIGWNELEGDETMIPNGVFLGGSGLTYSDEAAASRTNLINTHGWSIPNDMLFVPDIAVYDGPGNTDPSISNGQADPIDFGATSVGTTLEKTFAIEFSGAGSLSISSITSDNPAFTVSSAISTIPTGATETFTITLSGSATGTITANITIISDSADEGTFTFPITGEAVAPEITLYSGTDNTAPAITSGQAAAIDFGSALQGSDIVQIFAIENTGTADLTITDITSDNPVFTITSAIATIAVGATETFTITLFGATSGSFDSDITITNDDADEGTFIFPVAGEIVAPTPEIALYAGVDNTAPVITSGQVTAIEFGSALQGSDIVQTFAIENTGTADLTITDITSSDPAFTITSAIATIAVGATETFTITLSGATSESFDSDITITNDDADEGAFTFPVTGNITSPEIVVYAGADNSAPTIANSQATPIDFGSTLQGSDIVQTFAIENTGTADLTITAITSSDPAFTIVSTIGTIVSGATASFTITLSGATSGSFISDITITNDDSDEGTFIFPVTGEITAPEIALYAGMDNTAPTIASGQTTTIDFGSEVQGTDIVQTFAIENTGTADLTITAITSSDPAFAITSAIDIIAVGATETFTITLSGATSGSFAADITITNDDSDEGTFVFPVIGNITSPEIAVYAGADNTALGITNGQTAVIDFGSALQGSDIIQTLAIENTGTADLTITNITSNDPAFTIVSSIGTIVSGATASFTIELSGITPGLFSSNITITSNDADEGTFIFPVTGEITLISQPVMEVYFGQTDPGTPIPVSSSVTLGDFTQGTDPEFQFIIENVGTEELIITSIDSSDPSIRVNSSISAIIPGTTSNFSVVLDATNGGSFTYTITVVSNDPVNAQFDFTLTGTIELEEIEVLYGTTNEMITPNTNVDFGSTPFNVPVTRTFLIRNPSPNVPLDIQDIIITSTDFEIMNRPTTIATEATAELQVRLNASMEGSMVGEITILSNFADFTFSLFGEVEPEAPSVRVINVLTPNGDGSHDFLNILRITNYPSNEVTIFNKAGRTVYQARGYDNIDVRFEGVSNQGKSEVLSPGTYYYVIQLGNGQNESGFIQIITK